MSNMIDGFQKLLRRRRARRQAARPAPVAPPALPAERIISPFAPALTHVLPECLARARQRFGGGPSDPPCHSLFVAADLTASHLSPEECISLLMETRDDIRALVYQRAGWFRPLNTRTWELTHTLQCLASLIIEYHLREDAELVQTEREQYGQVQCPSPFPDPRFGFPVPHALNEPKV